MTNFGWIDSKSSIVSELENEISKLKPGKRAENEPLTSSKASNVDLSGKPYLSRILSIPDDPGITSESKSFDISIDPWIMKHAESQLEICRYSNISVIFTKRSGNRAYLRFLADFEWSGNFKMDQDHWNLEF